MGKEERREDGREGGLAHLPVDEQQLEGEDHAGSSEALGNVLEGGVRRRAIG